MYAAKLLRYLLICCSKSLINTALYKLLDVVDFKDTLRCALYGKGKIKESEPPETRKGHQTGK
jgi:hypothetical protein